jgi:hypothetical protein
MAGFCYLPRALVEHASILGFGGQILADGVQVIGQELEQAFLFFGGEQYG